VRLGSRTWTELDQGAPPRLLIPLGATEQHGPHLPLCTDTTIAVAVAEGAAAASPEAAVAPALPYGSSGEHAGFPGTLSLGQEALEHALVELVRSADHFADVVLVCWHGGNVAAVGRAVRRSRNDGRALRCWRPRLPDPADAHAGWIETSLMLAIAPTLVRDPRPVGPAEPLAALMPALLDQGVRAVSPTGVLGDARRASAAEGRDLLAGLVADLSGFLEITRPVALAP
jgi:mycofactocin precursor peptide peptidase